MIDCGARILTVLAIAGHDRAWLQRTTRLGANTIGRLLRDWQEMPAPATVEAVARSAGVSTEWLIAGDARRPLTNPPTATNRSSSPRPTPSRCLGTWWSPCGSREGRGRKSAALIVN